MANMKRLYNLTSEERNKLNNWMNENFEYKFLHDWILDVDTRALQKLDELIAKHPDCVYDGIGFRIHKVNESDIAGYLQFDEQENGFSYAYKDNVDAAVKQCILSECEGSYRSFSISKGGVLMYSNSDHLFKGNVVPWLLQSNIVGLDVTKLAEKIKQIEPHGFVWNEINSYLSEEEVLAKVNSDIKILGFYKKPRELTTQYSFVEDSAEGTKKLIAKKRSTSAR